MTTTRTECYEKGFAQGACHVTCFYSDDVRAALWEAVSAYRIAILRPGHDATAEAAKLALVVAESIDTLDAASDYAWGKRKALMDPFPAEAATVVPIPVHPSRPFSTSTKGE
jgi:hypothetical protein